MTQQVVPEGFTPIPRGLGFTDKLQPTYRRLSNGRITIGLVVMPQHGNTLGICHGGVLMTLADIAAASGVNLARGKRSGSPTINLAVDFIATAKMGEWIEATAEQVSVKRRFGFSSGAIHNSRGIVARFNGTFYLPDHQGLRQNGEVASGILQDLSDEP